LKGKNQGEATEGNPDRGIFGNTFGTMGNEARKQQCINPEAYAKIVGFTGATL